ncbi:uncharacterized protein [Diadema antillarum]|uniref:uncharacterized protein n=1 Tax=Diadema antillarum TaxID=105358 RepID=UPI003A8AE0A6
MSDNVDVVKTLKEKIENYCPGSTIRAANKRPTHPPSQTRIGLFGGPGVGKSALINSFLYATATDGLWTHSAPEGYQSQISTTRRRNAYDISEGLAVCDNRGMRDFGRQYMSEVQSQLVGVRADGTEVEWDRTFFQKFSAPLEWIFKAQEGQRIHCAVLVLSAKNLSIQPSDLRNLIGTVKKVTNQPPLVVITHKDSQSDAGVLKDYKVSLEKEGIKDVFTIENYTFSDHWYNYDKHRAALEILHHCVIAADEIMKVLPPAEHGASCTIQ